MRFNSSKGKLDVGYSLLALTFLSSVVRKKLIKPVVLYSTLLGIGKICIYYCNISKNMPKYMPKKYQILKIFRVSSGMKCFGKP